MIIHGLLGVFCLFAFSHASMVMQSVIQLNFSNSTVLNVRNHFLKDKIYQSSPPPTGPVVFTKLFYLFNLPDELIYKIFNEYMAFCKMLLLMSSCKTVFKLIAKQSLYQLGLANFYGIPSLSKLKFYPRLLRIFNSKIFHVKLFYSYHELRRNTDLQILAGSLDALNFADKARIQSEIAEIYESFVSNVFMSPVEVPEDLLSIAFHLSQWERIQSNDIVRNNFLRTYYAYWIMEPYNERFKGQPFAYIREMPNVLAKRYRDGWDFLDFPKYYGPAWITDQVFRAFIIAEDSKFSPSLNANQVSHHLTKLTNYIRNLKDGNEKESLKVKLFEKVLPYIFSQPADRLKLIAACDLDLYYYVPVNLQSAFEGRYFKYIQLMIKYFSYNEAAFLFSNALNRRELTFEQIQILYEDDDFVRALIENDYINELRCETWPLPLLLKEAKVMSKDPKYYTQAGRRFLHLKRLNFLTPEDIRFFTQNIDFMRHCRVKFGKIDTLAENGCNCLVS